MGAVPAVTVLDRASVSVVRELVRAEAAAVGFDPVDVERLALAASELAQNQLDHAGIRDSTVAVRRLERGGVGGLEIVAADRGPGLADPAGAVAGSVEPRGLGAGLPSVRRIAHELDLDSRAGEGTVLRARRFVSPAPAHPEVAVLGRGLERPSGDHAWVSRTASGLLAVVVDGLGHGVLAREAADVVVGWLGSATTTDPLEVLRGLDEACRGTRGAAATVARWDVDARRIELAGVGNVAARVITPGESPKIFLPTPGVLGARGPSRPGIVRAFDLVGRGVLVMHTDGISSHHEDPGEGAPRSPVGVAQHLLATAAKAHDDALVLVAR